ncbi:MAG: hypothetical protein IIZ92_22080, partial [Aquincola sp.]|nr:hypothetical protein [Aquincola sp.]
IRAGWAQFAADLAAYVPPEVSTPVVAAPQEHLPAVSVQLQGALAVVSNLQPFGEALKAFVAKIPKKPTTDQEFADTEAACKRLKAAEDMLQSAEDNALASMADVEAMRRTVAELRELARTTRLLSEKTVKARKEQIRSDEVARGHAAISDHLAGLHRRLGGAYITGLKRGDFGSAIKGLKSLDSLRNAIDTEIAAAKIEANQYADAIDANLKAIAAAGAPHLFNDLRTLVLKQPDDLAAVIAQRLAAEQQRQEAERERIRQQEVARVEREHQAAAAAKAAAPAPEPVAALAVAPAVARATVPLPPVPAVEHLADGSTVEVISESYSVSRLGVGQVERVSLVTSPMLKLPADAELIEGIPCLKLGSITKRFDGLNFTADYISTVLGVPYFKKVKAATYWRLSDFPSICNALAKKCAGMTNTNA